MFNFSSVINPQNPVYYTAGGHVIGATLKNSTGQRVICKNYQFEKVDFALQNVDFEDCTFLNNNIGLNLGSFSYHMKMVYGDIYSSLYGTSLAKDIYNCTFTRCKFKDFDMDGFSNEGCSFPYCTFERSKPPQNITIEGFEL